MKFLTRSNTENVSFEGSEETAEAIMNVILDSNVVFEAFGMILSYNISILFFYASYIYLNMIIFTIIKVMQKLFVMIIPLGLENISSYNIQRKMYYGQVD